MHLPGNTAPREPAWHHRKRKERSTARHIQWLGKELARTQPLLDGHHGSSSRSLSSMGKDGEWENVVARKKRKDSGPPVKCTKPGCTGTCPRRVVEQGLRGTGFTPAKCQLCDRRYKLVPGTATAPSEKKNQSATEKELREQVRKLEQKFKALEAAKGPDGPGKPAAEGPSETEPAFDPMQANIKAARDEVAAIRTMDPKLRGLIQGGYETALAAAQAKLAGFDAAKKEAPCHSKSRWTSRTAS